MSKYYIYIVKIFDKKIELIKNENFTIIIEVINEALNGNQKIFNLIRTDDEFKDIYKHVEILKETGRKLEIISKRAYLLTA